MKEHRLVCGKPHHAALVQQWQASDLCDATVVVSGQAFHAHRCVLAIGSELMAAHFRSHVPGSGCQLELNDLTPSAFYALLTCLYTGECSVEEGALPQLLEAAVVLKVPVLQEQCERLVRNLLTAETAPKVLELADRLSLSWLRAAGALAIYRNDVVADHDRAVMCTLGKRKACG